MKHDFNVYISTFMDYKYLTLHVTHSFLSSHSSTCYFSTEFPIVKSIDNTDSRGKC